MENKLNIIGSDGTATMTGKNSGCISSLENMIGRPLQWIVCLLHLNELLLSHIFQELDGKTKGPDSFSGTIGRQLNGKVSAWDVTTFQPVSNDQFPVVPDELIESLSSDQYYAMQICHAVMTGVVSQDLKYLEVGGLCHSRWLTLGCRILHYYVSKKIPTKNLRTLTEYLIRVYFPCWFRIKHQHRITDGSKNFFHMLKLISNFPNLLVRNVGLKVLQNIFLPTMKT